MSYAMAGALQSAVFQALKADAALAALVGDAVFDALPEGKVAALYVVLGQEKVREAGDGDGSGAWHSFEVSVVTDQAGFQSAKDVAAAISDALHGADLSLSRGRLVGLWFYRAKAARRRGGLRRVDLTFRARVEDRVGG